jgi:hypothetical protein
MNSKQVLFIATLVYAFVAIFLVIWFSWPKESQIKNQEKSIKPIEEEALSSPVFKNLADKINKGELVQFGNIPVTVDPSTQGKSNPFAE